jgi:signal transduction histidine kinase
MSDEVLNKIFIPFFTTKDINEGTGLGLAVVHGIITTHKGKIIVKSVVDKGTRFEIQFPILSKKPNKEKNS